jgi:hypothetical protein
MRDLVERAELDAAQNRIRVLVQALQREREARQEADRAQMQWQRLAKLRGQVIGQLREQLERQGVNHA